ncbi:MAG: heat-inducible transcription repressor HrcA [Myxococcales bacterium]|nr:heat-inducible transcription repressor HrcA [Myxococcales bacterium]
MLSPRGRRILFALVSEFIATGEPVASSALAREMELSSASIRAVLAELEGQGYLHKPHTSAGRIPTERALRVFVDALLATVELPGDLRASIEARFQKIEPGPEAALRATSKLLADVSGVASIVMSSPSSDRTLRELRFISLRTTEVLAVLVGNDGTVQNRVLRIEHPVSPSDLERANNILTPIVAGKTLNQVRATLSQQLDTERPLADARLRLALTLGERALARVEQPAEVLVEGTAQLIQRPEFADIDRARSALRTLEDKALLVQLIDRAIATPGLQVLIGAEDEITEAGALTVVAAPVAGGAIGVIGPTRIDYGSVVPAVKITAGVLERVLDPDADERDD